MTDTRIETVALTDGTELRLTVAEPDNVVRGGLVVLHEARGVTPRVRELVSALAEEGWLAAAPHLYHRIGVDELDAEHLDEDVHDQVQDLDVDSVIDDADATFLWLGDRGVAVDRLGVMGFDVGGAAALVVAARRQLGAAVTIGGGGILEPLSDSLPALIDIVSDVGCPWLGLYGADSSIPRDQIDKLREVADGAPVATDVVRFPASDHRFESEPESAHEAWKRTRNWFDLHLR
ncbi:carboxymethylenebutenolidase [Allosaccharopolyspora coralli]|uniref:Carboxymethylenebutenolidase n=1 Tax=Allosaccharopolyspora coralli TaxID=2665642 RepID=A0A5Q3Q480_9PSEU|nr:dienelactone hydrolase family protein [Allosaccharopolyspora coralli]QGK68316.1 carboxymethylenebutenolidase [Allosaccharopolyspora coralli]